MCRFLKKNVWMLFLILLSFSCTSCKKDTSPLVDPKADTSSESNHLHLYLQSEPISLDPRIGGNRNSQVFIRELFEGLMRIGENGKPYFAAAKSVDISKDGCTYKFTLNDSYWSTGEPVTAYDFEYAWKSTLSPAFATNFSYAFYVIKGAKKARLGEIPLSDVGIKAEDEHTLVVDLEHPAPYFLELTANPLYSPVSKKAAEKNPYWNKNGGDAFVSNGPFRLAAWSHQAEFLLTKNPFYPSNDAIKIDGIHVAIINEPQTALSLFEKGALDMAGEPFGTITLEAIPKLAQEHKLETKQIGALYWLEVNTKNPLLASAKIRKALAIAINRNELTEELLGAGEKPAFSVLPESLTLAKKPLFQDNDRKKAQTLFQEGLLELHLTKEELPPLIITYWAEAKEKAIATVLASAWSSAFGIKTVLSSCDWSTFLKKINSSDYEIAGGSWYTWYQDPIYNMEFMKYLASGLNGTNWESARYIELLDQSDLATDTQKRNALLAEAEQLIMDEMPIIPLFSQTYKYLQNPRLKGVYLTPVGNLELKNAYLEPITPPT